MNESDRRYPIGKFRAPESMSPQERAGYIESIESAPVRLREAVGKLSAEQLDTPYREGGWTPRQVIHHVPESHMNAYIRFKLALTETDPVIKSYDEAAWARLNDIGKTPVETSLALLDSLHRRWVILMGGMAEEDWGKRYVYPESDRRMPLEHALAMHAWHGDHHLAYIKSVAE